MGVIRDRDLLSEIQRGMLEAADGGDTFPSGLWTADEVTAYLNQRQRQFVKDTRIFVGRAPQAVTAGDAVVTLDPALDDVFQIIRTAWQTTANVRTPIPLSDTFAADHAVPAWVSTTAAVPLAAAIEDDATLTVRLMPPPTDAGTLLLDYIPRPPTLDRTGSDGNGYVLVVPPECALGLKWGTWADMLGKPGRAHDPDRAAYAERLYQAVAEVSVRLLEGIEG